MIDEFWRGFDWHHRCPTTAAIAASSLSPSSCYSLTAAAKPKYKVQRSPPSIPTKKTAVISPRLHKVNPQKMLQTYYKVRF
ncbi:hypothetical protein [Nostoc parmelioides]|uniref:Uncharacterized protein n=1 Tax=Nostoc parmelioides FACHB-3921 TaxID=2692909 RepID=A0ABR8BPD5_9NOSO|nr:hypothetical protein [Nostoc parmelioides]MBD2255650.1 hypothetical protein [Nostoc parmelioides FACHB-3921]